MKLNQRLTGLLAGALLLSACAPAPVPTVPAAPVMEKPAASTATAASMPAATEVPVSEAPSVTDQPAAIVEAESEQAPASSTAAEAASPASEETLALTDLPVWQTISLTDARTGEAFTLADFAGKTVFVEPFATWCSNCRQQLTNVQAARATFGEDVVFVTLSVEPNIGNDALVSYADGAGFEWIFAAMPPEMLQALAAQYGQTVANPPATPHFVIRPDGSATDLVTGIEAAEAIIQQIEASAPVIDKLGEH